MESARGQGGLPFSRCTTLSKCALILGAASILAGWAAGSYTYVTSREAALNVVYENNYNLANTLSQYADYLGEFIDNPEFLASLNDMWDTTRSRYSGRYLCILDAEGKALLHTARPDQVGAYLGSDRIHSTVDGDPGTVGELIRSKRDRALRPAISP